MTTPHFTCCAEPPPCPTCPEACDFETSYVFDGFSMSFSLDAQHGSCPKCVYEGGGGNGAYYQKSYSVNVTVTQIGQDVLTRYGSEGNCCYKACGTFEVEWEITDDVQYGCCEPENTPSSTPAVACSGTQTITGVEAVPYTYTIECVPAPIDGCPDDAKLGAVWVHTITLCGVQVATSHKKYFADCNYNPTNVDCGEEPGGALFMGGMVLRWWTPLIDLAAITPGMENTIGGPWSRLCNDAWGYCPGGECPEIFFYETPFGVGELPSGCTYDLDDCYLSCQYTPNDYPTTLFWIDSSGFTSCPYPMDPSRLTGSVCPCGNWTYECLCHRIDAGHVTAYPNYV